MNTTPLPSLSHIPKDVAIELMAEAYIGQLVRPGDKAFTAAMIDLLAQGLKGILNKYQLPLPTNDALDELIREACGKHGIPLAVD